MKLLVAAALLAFALVPPAHADYATCGSQVPVASVGGYSVGASHDASPCAAVHATRPGACLDVLWGLDLGIVVVGGSDTCQVLVKVDADGCRACVAILP